MFRCDDTPNHPYEWLFVAWQKKKISVESFDQLEKYELRKIFI